MRFARFLGFFLVFAAAFIASGEAMVALADMPDYQPIATGEILTFIVGSAPKPASGFWGGFLSCPFWIFSGVVGSFLLYLSRRENQRRRSYNKDKWKLINPLPYS